jgi:two-component system nitrate/nitrite response regulator NarL
MSVRVVVVAEDPLARAGVAALLAGGAVDLLGQAAPTDDLEADALAWDLGTDPRSGLDQLRGRIPSLPPVVALIARDDVAGPAIAAGVKGVLPRNTTGARLAAALAAVAAGLVVVDDSLASAVRPRSDTNATEALTPREQEVLSWMAEGLSNKLIADRLDISEHTAKFHVNAIFAKLGVTTRTEAVVQAVRRGLLLV